LPDKKSKTSVIVDYSEVHLKRLIVTNDRDIYESWKQSDKVGLLFEPKAMRLGCSRHGDPGIDVFMIGILPDGLDNVETRKAVRDLEGTLDHLLKHPNKT